MSLALSTRSFVQLLGCQVADVQKEVLKILKERAKVQRATFYSLRKQKRRQGPTACGFV